MLTSFNPGLCQNLTKYLTRTSEDNGKQVLLTTHNPYILDGLDLSDDGQRLLVCRRDIDGHTIWRMINWLSRPSRGLRISNLTTSLFLPNLYIPAL